MRKSHVQTFRTVGKSTCAGQGLNLHDVAIASPSSWCVCQFRHPRIYGIVHNNDSVRAT